MRHPQPRELNRRRVERLLTETRNDRFIGSRIELLSRRFLGQPYKSNPLIGSVETPEVFTAALDGFDCVTYIETVLALARAANVDDFVGWLRQIRYEQGRVHWKQRNHYMTLWIRNNIREGIISLVSIPALPLLSRERILNVVPGLAGRRTSVKCVPKREMARLAAHLRTGDLMFFVSTRKNLDVFHAGIIVRDGAHIHMRHASRSQGTVVEQDLNEFLKASRMAGVIAVRPHELSVASRLVTRTARSSAERIASSLKGIGVTRRSGS
jgi:cell wall-associated NlpC family hydrolase